MSTIDLTDFLYQRDGEIIACRPLGCHHLRLLSAELEVAHVVKSTLETLVQVKAVG